MGLLCSPWKVTLHSKPITLCDFANLAPIFSLWTLRAFYYFIFLKKQFKGLKLKQFTRGIIQVLRAPHGENYQIIFAQWVWRSYSESQVQVFFVNLTNSSRLEECATICPLASICDLANRLLLWYWHLRRKQFLVSFLKLTKSSTLLSLTSYNCTYWKGKIQTNDRRNVVPDFKQAMWKVEVKFCWVFLCDVLYNVHTKAHSHTPLSLKCVEYHLQLTI